MLLYIAVRCGFKLPIMPHYACYMRRIIALPIFHCSANLLCFSNIKCSIKQPLPRVLSLIAPILKFLTTMHSLTKLPFVFFRAFINFCIFYLCRFLKVVLPLTVPRFFYQWSRGVWFWTPIIEFCLCPSCPFPFWGMTCKFLLPFFVVFPFTATFCCCSLFRHFIQIACLFFLSWNFCRPSLSP